MFIRRFLVFLFIFAPTLSAQDASLIDDRILGVMRNYAVEDTTKHVVPLTASQKFLLFFKETADPYTFVTAVAGAGMSQYGNGTPAYGHGMIPYSQRLGAAYADLATQNFFSDAVLASVLHEDPRYYRMGPGHSLGKRIWYSLTRMVVTKTDSGNTRFNFSGVGGMALGIGLSNAYYPRQSVSGSVTGSASSPASPPQASATCFPSSGPTSSRNSSVILNIDPTPASPIQRTPAESDSQRARPH